VAAQNWDGSGGSGAALRHFEATGNRYPLAVKLGTITPHGADVYSYAPDENDMVLDPKLHQHLAHWGINMMQVSRALRLTADTVGDHYRYILLLGLHQNV
jgi:ubiquitin carboxyl-terminal hydrolase 5/13